MSFQKIHRYFIEELQFIIIGLGRTLIQLHVEFRHILGNVQHELLLTGRERSHRYFINGKIRLHEHPSVVPCDDRIYLQTVHDLVSAHLCIL